MGWLPTASGHQVTIQSGVVTCRNAKGRVLRTVPAKVRQDPVTTGLTQTLDWLTRHESQCRDEVERWMIRSLPVPIRVLSRVWPDDAWRSALTDLVVAVPPGVASSHPHGVGFLRAVPDSGTGVGVVDLDGETVQIETAGVLIPHPVLLPDRDELREFAADLGLVQSVEQLFRQTWVRAADVDPAQVAVSDYAGARVSELRLVTSRASQRGYPVRAGQAICPVVEDGVSIEARLWIGSDDPDWETTLGDLTFTRSGIAIRLGEVGPVSWSEGHRMAEALSVGRTIESTEGGPA